MALDHQFSGRDPQVIEAVENQYLYGRTKDVLHVLEKDTLDVVRGVMRSHRLEIDYPDSIPILDLISIAMEGLSKRHFSESEMKLLDVFKRRMHVAIDQLLDVFDPRNSEYGRVASRVMTALYSLNPPISSGRDFLIDNGGEMSTKAIEGALNAINLIESTVVAVRSKLTTKNKTDESDSKRV